MADPFEYDVFISFSSADEEIVKPIWQELCSNGLRVFWSDSTLKKEIGNSWFEVIEKSLERSKHMLLVCSDNSMNSKWVQREYRAFFDYCYSPNSRRLIPLLTREFSPKSLPLFLRELQVGKVSDSHFIQEMIPILGGVNIEKLQQELKSLQEQVNLLLIENRNLSKNEKIETNKFDELTEENKLLKEQLAQIKNQNSSLSKTMEEREKILLGENASLKEQIIKLNNENNLLAKKVSDGLLNSEIKSENFGAKPEPLILSQQIEEITRIKKDSMVDTSPRGEVQITKAEFAKLTYRQRFAVTEYGYLLSPDDAETVGKMLGNFQSKRIPPFCEQRGNKVTHFEQ